jgi:antibiotic biosynthesis monooxygenase (ABM) superfamily enzyme
MSTLADKTIIITGGAKNLGGALARRVGQDEGNVVVHYNRHASAEDAKATVHDVEAAGGRALAVQADLTDSRQVDALFTAAQDQFGAIYGVVNKVVYRFDTAVHLQAWLDSDERAAWLERVEPHVIGQMQKQVVTGLETWFTVSGQPGTPPPRYKMALVTWAAIVPLLAVIVVAIEPLAGELALVPRLTITAGITVSMMTWLVMPRLTRLLHGWLYPEERADATSREVRG